MSDEESLITPELLALVGRETPPREVAVAPETVRRVLETVADPDPRWRGDVAPPYVLLAFETAIPAPDLPAVPESLVTGDEWTLHRPLRTGEHLRMTGRLLAAHERFSGRFGHALALRASWTLTDADGTTVAEMGQSMIRYRTPALTPSPSPASGRGVPVGRGEGSPGPGVRASPAEGEGDPAERWPTAPLVPMEGAPLPPAVVRPTLDQVVRYCGLTWNFVPIFYDPAAAHRAGLPGTIVPGPLKLALLTRYLLALAGPGGAVRAVRCVHRRPDRTGAPLIVRGTVTRVAESNGRRLTDCELWTETLTGERSVTGFATIAAGSVS
jgi:acyl dehydratase